MPCGHTYVCNICASKIDKCVECRSTLLKEVTPPQEERRYVSGPRGKSSYGSFTAATSGRRSTGQHRDLYEQPPRQAIVKRERIPLPKNVVLLSLIESSQLVENTSCNRLLSRGATRSRTRESTFDFKDNVDADELEENRIIFGAYIANEACGTYAVATTTGLKIVQKRSNSPSENKAGSRNNERSTSNGRSISVIRARSPRLDGEDGDEMLSTATITNGSCKKKLTESWQGKIDEIVVNNMKRKAQNRIDVHLNYGDRVQIVSIVDKWAKLARGYGYVYLENSNDLVKVGGAIDKASKIESMIYTLSSARNKLMEAKRTTEYYATSLLKELQSTLVQEQDVTVIGAEAFHKNDRIIDNDAGNSNHHGNRLARFLDNGYASTEEDRRDSSNVCEERDDGGSQRRDPSSSTFVVHNGNRKVQYFPEAMAEAAQKWRERNGTEASEFTQIDFKTGMSGHHGLESNYANRHFYASRGRNALRMSAHSALTPK
ncbi:hypothetical protein CTEN210_00534 [Chaetoceros tenuissimus]|uniref:Uncharacterized protein n=1 Tax=Chaetoceros tenuissimus TaxID=426638 RepID=A0AAD3GYX5_9STRA|nr:hypothetical protein CTEN210_00534 [Chaetoceros tenuissimus]